MFSRFVPEKSSKDVVLFGGEKSSENVLEMFQIFFSKALRSHGNSRGVNSREVPRLFGHNS